ncbi:MAG TPA: HEAT repeat domain-containing protein [Gammaproteobacteria bacterium]|jgi:hypothetical protein|nr:HEAT repeat domain-containing protein [Gammaproteobacteria bacterium]
MNLVYVLAKYTVIMEFSLIVVIILLNYFLITIEYYKNKHKEKLTLQISNYFAQLIPLNASPTNYPFQKKWERIDIIVPVLYKFERLVQDESWEEARLQLIRSILLPLARKATKSKNWVQRFFAAESFGLVYEEKDEKHLIKLVQDTNPLIRLNALSAAIMRGSKSAVQLLITEIAATSWLTQSMYLQAFLKAPEYTRNFIIERLSEVSDPNVRATCYNILLRYPDVKVDWNIEEDLQANNIKLKISAIRYVCYVDKDKGIPLLLALLSHDNWQARTVALYILNNLRYTEAIPDIEACLNDPNEWVRLYAEETLKNLQQKGLGIVRTRDINEERAMFDVALQVLDTA